MRRGRGNGGDIPIFATVRNTRGGVGSPFIGAVCLAWGLPKYQSPLTNNIVYVCLGVYETRQFFAGFEVSSDRVIPNQSSFLLSRFGPQISSGGRNGPFPARYFPFQVVSWSREFLVAHTNFGRPDFSRPGVIFLIGPLPDPSTDIMLPRFPNRVGDHVAADFHFPGYL